MGIHGIVRHVVHDLAYVAGLERTASGANQTFLATYRVGDGAQQWKAPSLSAGGFSVLTATDTAVIAAGRQLEAHDALAGSLLCTIAVPDQEIVHRLIPFGDRTVTVGTKAINPPRPDQRLVIRILDAAGKVVAEDLRGDRAGEFLF